MQNLKRCPKCKQDKPETDFLSKNGTKYGYCRPCMGTYQKVYQQRVQDKTRPKACDICAVIFTTTNKPHWDHDHLTGAFRGWLCMKCNIMLGNARDSVEILEKAIEYLITKSVV